MEKCNNIPMGGGNVLSELPINKFNGFSTAKGTKCNISEESLKKGKNNTKIGKLP